MPFNLPGLVRDTVVPIAQATFDTARTTIGLERITGTTAFGPVYAAAVPVQAVMTLNPANKSVASASGVEHPFAAAFQFTGPIAVAEGDRITGPDGKKAAVIAIGGEIDPQTGKPYAPLAYTGKP